ncbi:hypothetical protein D3C76_1601740 [compost metagenome]
MARLLARTPIAVMVRLAAVIAVYPKRSMGQPQIALKSTWVSSLSVDSTLLLA